MNEETRFPKQKPGFECHFVPMQYRCFHVRM